MPCPHLEGKRGWRCKIYGDELCMWWGNDWQKCPLLKLKAELEQSELHRKNAINSIEVCHQQIREITKENLKLKKAGWELIQSYDHVWGEYNTSMSNLFYEFKKILEGKK